MVVEWVKDLLEPCFDCQPQGRAERTATALRSHRAPGNEVELAVSALAGLRGFAGYHTSVLVAGEEYYFSPYGICSAPKLTSHEQSATLHHEFIGLTEYTGTDLLDFLTEYFRPCTYDLLRKNCNSFTDCALFFLCQQRLDARFTTIEQLGRAAEEHAGIVQVISGGEYVPNPRAFGFNVEVTILDIMRSRDEQQSDSDSEDHNVADAKFASGLPPNPHGYIPDSSSFCGAETHPWLRDNKSQFCARATNAMEVDHSMPNHSMPNGHRVSLMDAASRAYGGGNFQGVTRSHTADIRSSRRGSGGY